MLYTKPQGHWPFVPGEEDFWRVFTTYGRGGHLSHVTQMPRTNFHSLDPWRRHMKFFFDWPSGFGEEDLWKYWTDDGECLYYTHEPEGSGELKMTVTYHFLYILNTNFWASKLKIHLLSQNFHLSRAIVQQICQALEPTHWVHSPSLIWVFAGHTDHFVGFVMRSVSDSDQTQQNTMSDLPVQ